MSVQEEVTVVRVVWLLVSTPLDHTSVLATMATTKFGERALPMVSGGDFYVAHYLWG